MPTLQELCSIAERSHVAAAPLLQACASPRSVADLTPLPAAHNEAAFDSSWEVLLAGMPVTDGTEAHDA